MLILILLLEKPIKVYQLKLIVLYGQDFLHKVGRHKLQVLKQKMTSENLNRGQILKSKIHLVVMDVGIARGHQIQQLG